MENAAGRASLAIVEALILLLLEERILSADQVIAALEDLANSYRTRAASDSEDASRHMGVARAIDALMCGTNLQGAVSPFKGN